MRHVGAANPLVVCVCLTAERWRHTSRAIRCFESQTYPNKQLLLLDNGVSKYPLSGQHPLVSVAYTSRDGKTLGALRNMANTMASHAELIATWDSDDWRHPESLTEMIAHLVATGRQIVGYSDALYYNSQTRSAYLWRSNLRDNVPDSHPLPGSGVLGGSHVYWRSAWVDHLYPVTGDIPGEMYAEDELFSRGLKIAAMTSAPDPRPRMIVDRHAANTSKLDLDYQCEQAPQAWKRAREWDSWCADRLAE